MLKRAKDSETKDLEAELRHVDCVLYLYAESLRIMAILLQPFIPQMAKRMLDVLGVSSERRSMHYAHYAMDSSYCRSLDGTEKAPILFPLLRITEEELAKL